MNLDYFRSHYPTPTEGIFESLIGLGFYLGLFRACDRVLTRVSSTLSRYDILEISNKIVSSTFAVITCSLAIKAFGECGDDLIHERHFLVRHFMCFAVFYFLYDTYAMFVVYHESLLHMRSSSSGNGKHVQQTRETNVYLNFVKARPLIVAHHMVLPLVLFPIFMTYETGLGDCLLTIGFLMEASTPFVCARKILSIMGWKKTFLYCLNGAVMTLVFFGCRILIFPIVYYLYAKQIGSSYFEAVIYRVPWFCSLSIFIIWLPQVYWWKIMLSGCVKVLSQMKQSKTD